MLKTLKESLVNNLRVDNSMLEKMRSYKIKFIDYLDKNPTDVSSILMIYFGLTFLWLASKNNTPADLGIVYVFGIVSTIVGIIFGVEIILRKKFNNNFLTEKTDFIISVLLIIALFPQIVILNSNSTSYILMLIVIVYSVRIIIFSFFIFTWKSVKLPEEDKKFNASVYSFEITLFSLLLFSSFRFLLYKVFILFLVYGIYYLIREKYLAKSIKSSFKENITLKKSVFSEVWNISYLASYILLIMFLLFYFNVLTISLNQPTLYYFYSTTAQIFATLLGIVVMFSILILQKTEKEHADRYRFLKKGLKGFTIIYTIIIAFSITGILIKDTINFNSIERIPDIPDINMVRDILNISVFELVFLMIPAALLYLYAMISDFLNWDIIINAPSGTTIPFNPETVKKINGADRTKIVIGKEEQT